jgi:hypothetical protein
MSIKGIPAGSVDEETPAESRNKRNGGRY